MIFKNAGGAIPDGHDMQYDSGMLSKYHCCTVQVSSWPTTRSPPTSVLDGTPRPLGINLTSGLALPKLLSSSMDVELEEDPFAFSTKLFFVVFCYREESTIFWQTFLRPPRPPRP